MVEMVVVVVGIRAGGMTQLERTSTSYPFLPPFEPQSVVFYKKEKINLNLSSGEANLVNLFKKAVRAGSDFVSIKIIR